MRFELAHLGPLGDRRAPLARAPAQGLALSLTNAVAQDPREPRAQRSTALSAAARQGGTELAPFFDGAGRGAVVNSSRGILYAGEGIEDWPAAVAAAALDAKRKIEAR